VIKVGLGGTTPSDSSRACSLYSSAYEHTGSNLLQDSSKMDIIESSYTIQTQWEILATDDSVQGFTRIPVVERTLNQKEYPNM